MSFPLTKEESIRTECLEKAIRSGVDGPDKIVDAAKMFERFVKGEDDNGKAEG